MDNNELWLVTPPGKSTMEIHDMPLWCKGQATRERKACCFAERDRIMDIVKKQIGLAMLDTDEELSLAFFKDLYERIEEEVKDA